MPDAPSSNPSPQSNTGPQPVPHAPIAPKPPVPSSPGAPVAATPPKPMEPALTQTEGSKVPNTPPAAPPPETPKPPAPPTTPASPSTSAPAEPAKPTPSVPAASGEAAKPLPPSSRTHWLIGALVIIAAILVLLVLGVLLYPRLHTLQQQPTPTTTPVIDQAGTVPTTATVPVIGGGTPTTPNATTTTTSTPAAPAPVIHQLGQTVELTDDQVAIFAGHPPQQNIEFRIVEFFDSRCPMGVRCDWPGELGVKLNVRDVAANESADIYLGPSQAKTFTAYGVTVELNQITERKGGDVVTFTVR